MAMATTPPYNFQDMLLSNGIGQTLIDTLATVLGQELMEALFKVGTNTDMSDVVAFAAVDLIHRNFIKVYDRNLMISAEYTAVLIVIDLLQKKKPKFKQNVLKGLSAYGGNAAVDLLIRRSLA